MQVRLKLLKAAEIGIMSATAFCRHICGTTHAVSNRATAVLKSNRGLDRSIVQPDGNWEDRQAPIAFRSILVA